VSGAEGSRRQFSGEQKLAVLEEAGWPWVVVAEVRRCCNATTWTRRHFT